MPRPLEIHGYAIVSANDRIADAAGIMPTGLHNPADWAYFQAGLDGADLIALGRVSHEATANPKGRRRLALSRHARGLERRADAMWWNPDERPWRDVARELLPEGGRVAVPGGQAAFDVFLAIGYSAFHLSRARTVSISGGRGLFAACERAVAAEAILAEAGLVAGDAVTLDRAAEVTLTVWRRR